MYKITMQFTECEIYLPKDLIMVPRTHSVRRGHSVLKINFLAVAIFVKKLIKIFNKTSTKIFFRF